jgi:uncharacterized membrane protein (UPF0127 family)
MRFSASIQGWRFSASIQSWRCSALTRAGRFGALALVVLWGTASAAASDARLPLRIGPHAFQVELATTPPQRERGLMGRTQLAPNGGMLFVFEQSARHCFWMRNTPLPLSIAFVDADGRIVSLADMQPHTETLHCPPADIRYALEVRQGEFRRRGIAPHAQVDGLPR